jgi:large subunit ribosomal protein L21
VYAVIETGGKQVTVRQGDVVKVERLQAAAGETVTLDRVLVIGDGQTLVGAPTITGASVQAKVVRQGRGPKVTVMKFKAKSHSRRKTGHRQAFTELRIEQIAAPGRQG